MEREELGYRLRELPSLPRRALERDGVRRLVRKRGQELEFEVRPLLEDREIDTTEEAGAGAGGEREVLQRDGAARRTPDCLTPPSLS